MSEPLKIAVVGHTNVGKTSLLRTLARDIAFGRVSPDPGTTRHVEGICLSVGNEPMLNFYDTPGMEDAIALRDYLDELAHPGERLDGPTLLARFFDTIEAKRRFEQEAKVLRQMFASDAGLYVIDVREPILAKYRDELAILNMSGKPLLAVFNFTAAARQYEGDWREALARLGLHALIAFDSVAPPLDGERRLYETLALLLERARPQLVRLIEDRAQQRVARAQTAMLLIAEMIIGVAAERRRIPDQETIAQNAVRQLQRDVRAREQHCVDTLLKLYAFRTHDVDATDLPLLNGRWEDDLFNPETLKQFGIKVGGGMAAGAAAGAGIDLMAGGMTLGAAALLGALIGGGTQTIRHYGERLRGKITGQRELTVDDNILRLLVSRQLWLMRSLETRGHAAFNKIIMASPDQKTPWPDTALPEPIEKARAHPEWSTMGDQHQPPLSERQDAIDELAGWIIRQHAPRQIGEIRKTTDQEKNP